MALVVVVLVPAHKVLAVLELPTQVVVAAAVMQSLPIKLVVQAALAL